MATDGDDGVAEPRRSLDQPLELGAVLDRAELGLVGLEVDGEGKDGALVQRAAGAELLDFALHRLGPEPFTALQLRLRQVA